MHPAEFIEEATTGTRPEALLQYAADNIRFSPVISHRPQVISTVNTNKLRSTTWTN